ncbi:MAG: efflux RND transporter periplasmic adaptor subunit [Fibrobacterota bacterium]
MKKVFTSKITATGFVWMMLALFVGAGFFASCGNKSSTEKASSEEKAQVYHCPMHPNYLSHSPGQCPICGMTLVPIHHAEQPGTMEKTTQGKRILYYRDAMNPSFTSDKPGKAPDGMDLVPVYGDESSGSNSVRISPDMVQSMGVRTEKAVRRRLSREIRVNANIVPDERRISMVTARIGGYVEKLHANFIGRLVKKSDPLYDIFSSDLVSVQNEYLNGLGKGENDPMAVSAHERMLSWNVPDEEIQAIRAAGAPRRVLTIVSPFGGVITEKMVVEGQAVEMGMPLFRIIDYSKVWAVCNVYQQDIPFIRVGQQAEVTLDFYPDRVYKGSVTYVAAELDMESRTLGVRVELANTADLKIKPGMVATVRLVSQSRVEAVTVPEQAVIRSGIRNIVIVSKGEGYFEPREVKMGATAEGYAEIFSGISDGEEIVVSSQFLIDSESNLKAAVMQLAPERSSDSNSAPSSHTAQKKQLYTCPMHPEIIRDKPGDCPKCGMALVPKT